MNKISESVKSKPWLGWLIYLITIIIVFLIGLLASSIVERKAESVLLQTVKPIAEWEPRNEVWGENYPREYQSYLKTADTTFASKHGGSVTIDMLEKNPDLVIMWAGYAFSREYNQSRGHYYALKDVRMTLRTAVPQPSTCWTCKSTDVPRLMNQMGFSEFYKTPWGELGSEISNSIGCQDCHDPKTMNLRITRPALVEAFQRKGIDINKSTHQELRSLVCAQCHVEYYFKGEDKYLTLPWDKGFSVEDMEAYYDSINHTDWVHQLSKAPMLKSQHPDFEIFKFGIHSERGISCAECHMPYKTEGGVKFTDHHVQSPLNNINNSCAVCHREDEKSLMNDVYKRQDKILELSKRATTLIVKAHLEAKVAWDNGAKEEDMKPILKLIRQAQWRWDYVMSSNGGSFHAPLESARILGASIEKALEARLLLSELLQKLNVKLPVPIPDLSTKIKAQEFIGLNMKNLWEQKMEFINNTISKWKSPPNY